jgi:membrane-associated phospholipid phosphatase
MADAAIAAWDAKYHFHNWRPITAIRNTDDPAWLPYINTPSFPDYVSGHSTFSGAAATVLTSIFGENFAFTTDSDALAGVQRSFSSFSEAADEAALSRLYGGIHFSAANNDGKAVGIQIGQHVVDNFLRPLPEVEEARSLRRA